MGGFVLKVTTGHGWKSIWAENRHGIDSDATRSYFWTIKERRLTRPQLLRFSQKLTHKNVLQRGSWATIKNFVQVNSYSLHCNLSPTTEEFWEAKVWNMMDPWSGGPNITFCHFEKFPNFLWKTSKVVCSFQHFFYPSLWLLSREWEHNLNW